MGFADISITTAMINT